MGLQAQCPITVNAGPDQLVCAAGGMATLQASVTGPYLGFAWSPTTGLNDPNDLNPIATVNGPLTYILSAQAVDPSAPNLVNNPDFQSGNSGFTSQYSYNPLPITPGTYVLTTSPALVLSTFPPCDDHTSGNGTGNMMLVNGNASTGAQVWCQDIPVAQNTWYVMSAWVMASPITPPVMQFSVNGVAIGEPYPVGTGTCNWQQFNASWYSGSSSTAQLCILDQISGGNGFLGDDYALDDIFFAAACTITDQVNVGIATVNANSPATATLFCNNLPGGITLSGAGSSTGTGYTYQWDGPGVIGPGNTLNATVNQEGQYTLTVSFDSGNGICTDQSTTLVLPDPNIVVAAAATTETITCINPTVILDGTGTSVGSTISYNWQPAANVVAGQGTLMPEVNQQGLYTLSVTNSLTGCTATATVFVNQNTTLPTATAAAQAPLSCSVFETTVTGNGSSTGSNISYQWTGAGIVSGDDLINCTVNLPGQFVLTVTNTDNGCTATATATVTSTATPPTASASASGNLSCSANSVTLSSNGSSTGPNISFGWATPNGHFTSPTNGPTATVDSAGVYVLTVTNIANGCTATASVSVSANFATPTAQIAPPAMLNCLVDSVQLDASQSSSGAGISFVWASPNGGIFLSGQSTLTPWVGSAAVYNLTLTNSASGCTASASVTVSGNSTQPIAQAGTNATLDCNGTAINLNGTGSSTGSGISYQWTTNGGNIVSGDTTLTPEVDGVGTYFLLVENTANGCTALDSVIVIQDSNAPTVVIAPAAPITCLVDEVTLNATGSSTGPNITITWNGPSFSSGLNTLTPTVNQPGVYQLILLNTTNNCVANASVTVGVDTLAPVADAGPAPTNGDCFHDIYVVGLGSSQGSEFSYLWSNGDTNLMSLVTVFGTYYMTLTVTNNENGCIAIDSVLVDLPLDTLPAYAVMADTLSCANPEAQITILGFPANYSVWAGWNGGIVSGMFTFTPVTNMPGFHFAQVFNEITGCYFVISAFVEQADDSPIADAGNDQSLGCGAASLVLDGTGSSNWANLAYEWTTTDGSILNGSTSLTPEIGGAGTYTLTVVDTLTNCQSSDLVTIFPNNNPAPTADAGASQTLLCGQSSLTLNGAGSSSGAGFSYLWTTQNGNILNGDTTLAPTVNAPGLYTLTVTDLQSGCSATDDVQVGQDANAPTADAGAPQSLSCSVQSVLLDGTASSSGPGISYLWTTVDGNIFMGETTLTPTVDAPGTYLLTVTNSLNNCQSLASVQVMDNVQPPTAVANAPQQLGCGTISVMLDGSGSSTGAGITYLWTGPGIQAGATTLQPTVNAPGVYTLTVTNDTGNCTNTAQVTVTQDNSAPTAVAAAPQDLTCLAQQVQLSGVGSSVGVGYSYQWQGPGIVSGATTLSPTANLPGTYTLTVTAANGCSASASAVLMQDATLPVAVAAAPQDLTCVAQQVQLSGAGSSVGVGYSYQWQGPGIVSGGTTLSPIANLPGTYTLTVTAANGCTASATVLVNQTAVPPIAAIAPPQVLNCNSPTIILDGMASSQGVGISFNWAGPGVVANGSSLSPTVDASGIYTLTITDQNSGCTATAQVNVLEDFTPPVVDAGPSFALTCGQGTVTLQASTNVQNIAILWLNPSGIVSGNISLNPVVNAPGTYVFYVNNMDNGCSATDSTVVTEQAAIFPVVEITQPTCAIPTGSFEFSGGLDGALPFVYSLDNGANFNTQSLYDNMAAGNYTVVAQDANGCEQTFEIELMNDDELIIALVEGTFSPLVDLLYLAPQINIPASEVATVVWTPTDYLDCSTCLNPTATVVEGILTYNVTITSVNGCTATGTITRITPQPSEVPPNIYVPNAFSPNGDGINDVLTVFADDKLVKNIVSFQVFSRWGESVFTGFNLQPNDLATGWDGSFRGKEVDLGVFAWYAEVELTTGEKKLLKGDVVVVR